MYMIFRGVLSRDTVELEGISTTLENTPKNYKGGTNLKKHVHLEALRWLFKRTLKRVGPTPKKSSPATRFFPTTLWTKFRKSLPTQFLMATTFDHC